MIRLVDELERDATGAVVMVQDGKKVAEGTYYRCPETGNVSVAIQDDHEDVDASKSLKLTLQDQNNSTYEGNFVKGGEFKLFRS